MEDNIIRMQYATACRNLDLNNVNFKADVLSISNSYPQWTSKGKIGTYIWRSLTTLYVPGFISVDQNMKLYNDHHLRCTHKGGSGMASIILRSIHHDMELKSILQNQRIVNTDIMYADGEFPSGIPADYGFPESPRGYSFSELADML